MRLWIPLYPMPPYSCPTPHFRRRRRSVDNLAAASESERKLKPSQSAPISVRPQQPPDLSSSRRKSRGHALANSPKFGESAFSPGTDEAKVSLSELAASDVDLGAGNPQRQPRSHTTSGASSSVLWTRPLSQIPPSNMTLSGKVALVTGGARGIGAAIAIKLAKEGARVAFTFHDTSSIPKAHAVISTIESLGSSATAIQFPLLKSKNGGSALAPYEKVVAHVLRAFGVDRLDILVNNAGTGAGLATTFDETDPETFDALFDVNARAVFFTMQAAQGYLAPGGRIINVSAAAARGDGSSFSVLGGGGADKPPCAAAFAGSKAAVEAFTRVIAREFAEEPEARGITVNCVSPGRITTGDDEEVRQEVEQVQQHELEGDRAADEGVAGIHSDEEKEDDDDHDSEATLDAKNGGSSSSAGLVGGPVGGSGASSAGRSGASASMKKAHQTMPGTAEDVAEVVAFLASGAARWITGSVVPVNGGKLMI